MSVREIRRMVSAAWSKGNVQRRCFARCLMSLCLLAAIGCFEKSEESQARDVVKEYLDSWAYGDSLSAYWENHPKIDGIGASRSQFSKLLSYDLRSEARKEGDHAYGFSALLVVKHEVMKGEGEDQKLPVRFVVKRLSGNDSKEWKLSMEEHQ